MGVVTVRPASTSSTGGAAVSGAATQHAALSDDSDSSYVNLTSNDNPLYVTGDPSFSAGDLIKGVAIRARMARIATGQSNVTFEFPFFFGATVNATSTITTSTVASTTTLASDFSTSEIRVTRPPSAVDVRLYELYLDFTYVAIPVVSADAPTGTIGDNNQPTVEWSNTLDADGGGQTYYEVKVYTDAQYGAGGFDPDTSTPTAESGEVASSDLSWQVDTALVDDTYRAYVRVAQTVNGNQHWSDWDSAQWTQATDLPAITSLTATASSPNGRIGLTAATNPAGAATADYVEFQVQIDGEYHDVYEGGLVAVSSNSASVNDYESPNGTTTTYRARAVHDYGDDNLAYSTWVTDTEAWSSSSVWLKHPTDQTLNAVLPVHSFATRSVAQPQSVFKVLGRSDPIVVSDTRGPKSWSITFLLETVAEQDKLDALLDSQSSLLLQFPSNQNEDDKWIRAGDHERTRAVDKGVKAATYDTLTITQVARPDE